MPRWLKEFPFWHELVLVALLAGLLTYAGVTKPRFLSRGVQLEFATQVWELALLTLPMTLIIITAGIDLSVGSTMALSAVVLGLTWRAGVPLPIACALALLTGALAGLLNGILIAFVRVHPLIVTLATLSAYRGLAEGISHAQAISGYPDSFTNIVTGNVAGLALLPVPGVLFVLAAIGTGIVLNKTPFGRSLFAMGFNESACRFSGIPTRRIKLTIYTLAGFTAAVSAILFVARRNTAKADVGTGMELDVITAVVLGGTSIFGGRGRIVGTILGVLVIHETKQFVSWRWDNDVLIYVVVGCLLILSVLLNTLVSPRGRE
jgi:rhamnose transport system permease protein